MVAESPLLVNNNNNEPDCQVVGEPKDLSAGEPLSLLRITRKYDKVYLKHCQTGDVFFFKTDKNSRSLYRFRSQARGLERTAESLDLDIYFMTLTLRDNELDVAENTLKKFLDFMRIRFKRQNLPFYYIWAVELQKKRYLTYRVPALHWHFAIAVPVGSLPNVAVEENRLKVISDGAVIKNRDLVGAWGRGRVHSILAWENTFNYLSKYISKDYSNLENYNPAWSKLRRFGSSQFGYYSYPKWAFDKLNNYQAIEQVNVSDLYIKKQGSKVTVSGYDSLWAGLNVGYELNHKIELAVFRSPYVVVKQEYQEVNDGSGGVVCGVELLNSRTDPPGQSLSPLPPGSVGGLSGYQILIDSLRDLNIKIELQADDSESALTKKTNGAGVAVVATTPR